ncbi:MAG: hypothetical protein LBR86_07355, partial [Tannerella sp.]|nr:hypothetical protein [Tannerella sp.]
MSNLNLTKIRSSYNGQTPSTGKEVEDAFNDNFEAIDASLETLGALNQDLFSFPGYISGYNGKVVDSDSYLHTVYIPVVNAKSITVTGFSGGPVTGLALIAFYNKYKTHTGMFGTGTEPADVTATVPAASFPQDTYYVRCTARPQQANRSVTISFASIMQTVVDSGNAFSATLYNVTQNNPLPDGQYYTAVSARLAVPVELRRPGLILTFALSAQQWFTMQFTGTDPASFTHPDFWNDIQAMINASLTPLQQQIAAINNSIATMAGNIAQVGQTASGASALATLLQQHLATVDNSITTMAGNIAQVGQTASGASALAALTKENLDALTDTVDELSAGLLAVDNAKVDYGYVENGFLFLTSKGETVGDPIELPAGGGGSGGGGSTLRLINQGGSSMGVAAGQPVVISYIYQSTDSETGEATGDGTAQYYVNNVRVATRSIQQGLNTFDATPHLTAGANSVKVQVTDSYGAVRSMNVSVAVMSLSLSSSFDDGAVYDGPVSFPFTPVGSGQKTVYFVLDGTVGTMETTATNRQLIYPLGALGHGFHLLKVYAEMTVQGVTVRSNELVYGITFVEAGAQEVIISSPFVRESAGQYETVVIPFTVYNPASLTSAVALMTKTEGGDWQTVSTLTVDRTRQAWSYRIASSGTLDLKIVSGSAFVSFQLEVSASSISADAETEGLELFLTSEGRNNAESNPGEWAYGDIKAIFTGLNWKTNGWILDAGNTTVLRLNAGARVNLPLKPFAQDFKNAGKTVEIEFAVHDVEDFTVPVISCWSGGRGFRITPNRVDFASQLSSLAANFKEDEIIRLSIVVENRYDKHLILLYINGVASGAQQYSLSDDFSQTSPAGIALGTDGTATLDVYTVRVYGQALNGYQILNNYIADTADVARKLALYERNRIYDGSGDIVYSDLVEKLPCMTVTGVLPTFKGDKKTVKIAFENRENPEKSFTSENVQIDVQGTSSQFYPRKNFKTKHNSGFDMSESGEHTDKYVLLGEDIEAKVFCEKADFAESSGTHNTGLARFINTLLVSRNIKTPPQNANANVRTT